MIGWAIANVIQRVGAWSLSDMDAYWNAALRLRAGQPLYPAVADAGAADVYRYAPWFAWLWVPLVGLPKGAVAAGWSALLLAASAAAILPFLRARSLSSVGAAALLGSILVWSASSGNVHPLIVAVLVYGVERRSGPFWIGMTASLKLVPIVLALVYVGRREWRRAVVATGVALALWATALTQNLAQYPLSTADSPNPLLAISPVLYVVVVLAVCVTVLILARTRHAWLAAATATFVAIPRVSLIELSYLALAGQGPERDLGARSLRPSRVLPSARPERPLARQACSGAAP